MIGYADGRNWSDPTGAKAPRVGGSVLGKLMVIPGVGTMIAYDGMVLLVGLSKSTAGTWFPVALIVVGTALIAWGRTTELFEDPHVH